MSIAWGHRTVDGPDKDLLTGPEVARLFGFSEDTLRRLQEAGKFPCGIKMNSKTVVYDWQSIAFFRLYMTLQARFNGTGLTAVEGD